MSDEDYVRRVDRVRDHVRHNLREDLTLDALAKVGCFSPYHFHRVFKAVAGETLAAFTRRARLERAVYLMRGARGRSLTSIALEVGFGAPSDLSRAFRAEYGIAPSAWDRASRLDGGRDFASEVHDRGWTREIPQPQVVELDACTLAYLRVEDPWRGGRLRAGYERLTTALAELGLDWKSSRLLGMSWDSEVATPIERLVYDLALTVHPEFEPAGALGRLRLPARRAVEIHCENLSETALGWEFLYTTWLPESGYEPDELPAIKRFRRTPGVLDAAAWDVDCSISIRPCGGFARIV